MNTDRFKFRVWDKESKRYRYDLFCLAADGMLYDGESFVSLQTTGEDRFIMEQCTGLRDTNEKLIYQGDIVKVVYFDYEDSDYTMQGDIAITKFGVMLDHVKGEHFKTYTGGSENVHLYEWLRDFVSDSESQIEIIGNIHEEKWEIEQ